MKILEVLTYYRPHISGLTIYVERLSKALTRKGHEVTVLTSQYDRSLPREEINDGVIIRRIPVAFRVSKGVIMPTFGPTAWKLVRGADIVHLHLPQFDAPGVALRGRYYSKPVVLTYHSDLHLPEGLFNRLVDRVVVLMNRIAGSLADAVVTYTYDFGQNSPYLSHYFDKKLHVIPPPVELPSVSKEQVDRFKRIHKLDGKKVIGISARMAAEKGIEVLLESLPEVIDSHPSAVVLHASPEAIGEDAYARKLAPLLARQGEHYRLLGALEGADLTAFYKSLDCLVMCSLNNTETFGLVQIEAMINGVPVVASDLPGVRQPVTMTGMGLVTPVGNPAALAKGIVEILDDKSSFVRPAEMIAKTFNPNQTASDYLDLFDALRAGTAEGKVQEPHSYSQLREMRDRA